MLLFFSQGTLNMILTEFLRVSAIFLVAKNLKVHQLWYFTYNIVDTHPHLNNLLNNSIKCAHR